MSGTTDEVKGRIKEAAGALTGDKKLRDEGKTDQVVGKVKQAEAAQQAVHKAEDAAEKAVDKANEAKDATKSCPTECD